MSLASYAIILYTCFSLHPLPSVLSPSRHAHAPVPLAHTATVYRLQYLLAATNKHACAPADYGIASLLNYTLKEEEELLERLLDTERKLAEAMRVIDEHDHKKSVHSELPDEVTTLKRKIDEYSVRESTLQQQVDSLNQVSLSFSEVYATEPCCDK